MSIRQVSLVLQMPPRRLSNTEFRVLVHLADRADDDGGNIFPDVARLMKVTGRAKREVNRTLSALLKRGWVRTEELAGKPRWRLALRLGNTKKWYTSVPIFGTPSDAQTTCATNHLGAGTDRPPSFDPSYVQIVPSIEVPNSQVPAPPTIVCRSKKYTGRALRAAAGAPPVVQKKEWGEDRNALSREPADDDNYAVLLRLVHHEMDRRAVERQPVTDPTDPDFIDLVKTAAAQKRIHYDPSVLQRALRAAGYQRTHTRPPESEGPLAPLCKMLKAALDDGTVATTTKAMARKKAQRR